MNGIIIVNKSKDFTSFDTVAVMRGICRERRIGHAGTLDPMATGVLPILLGCATKAQALLPDSGKTYEARFRLGMTTDTLDISGKVLSENAVHVVRAEVEEILERFRGDIMQKPPMYSAKYKDGVRLYDLARQGIEVERTACPVTIFQLKLNDFDETSATGSLTVSCSKGTYIRSLIDDIGAALGCGAVMTDLCRTAACGYSLQEAHTLQEIQSFADNGILEQYIQPVDSVFRCYPYVKITEKQSVRFKNGGGLDLERLFIPMEFQAGGYYRVYGSDGAFLGLGVVDGEKNCLAVQKLFWTE